MAATGAGAYAPGVGAGQGEEIVRQISRTLSRTFSSQVRQSERYLPADDSSSDESISKADDWKLMPEVKEVRAQDMIDKIKSRRLGVTWRDLTVKGVGADAAINENVLSQFNIFTKIRGGRQKAPLKTIIDSSHGCVKPGEMLLVLGRPGSGCTSLMKVSCSESVIETGS